MKASEVKKVIAEVLSKPPSEIKDDDVVTADQCHKIGWTLWWKGYSNFRVDFCKTGHTVAEICESYNLAEKG